MKTINYSGSSKLISRIVYLLNRKAPLPLDGDGDPSWGTNGQVLTTDGTGATYWSAGGGSGDVTDVEVNGTSVVNAQGVAEVSVPTNTSDLNNDSDFIDSTDLSTALADYTPTASLASVATSGQYSDLSGTPSLATVATSGDYDDLTNKPTIPAAQVNSDWNAVSGVAQILNKPTIPTVNDGTLTIQQNGTTVGTFSANQSGDTTVNLTGGGSSYTAGDGINISAQNAISVDTAFTEASTRANIASGDTLATIWGKIKKFFTDLKTVAFTGSYNDLSNKPTIPDISTKVSKSGDTMSGCLSITSTGNNFTEGVRINTAPNGFFTLLLGGSGDSGTRDGAFWLGGNNTVYPRILFVAHNGSNASTTYFHASSSSDSSPKLHVPSGSIASGDGDAVTGNEVYLYIASGKSDRDEHNANSALKNGVYYYTSNGPATSLGASTTDGALYVQQYSDSWVAQIAQDYRNGRLFVRGKNNGSWTSWLRVALFTELYNLISSVSYSNGVLSVANFSPTPITTGTEINIVKSGKGTIEVQGASLASRLVLQSDYNLVLYKNGSAVWQSGTSSRRFKHNIQSMTEERAKKILDVRAVTFDWNDGQPVTTQKCDNAGVIAEEVSQVIPDVVVFEQYDNDTNVRIERRVEYERFTPYLIKMVQMQQKQIDTMQATINALEQRLSKLEGK